ncbi:MAG: dihydrodipicolinate synthase family protein [Flavobacteriales bacterium]
MNKNIDEVKGPVIPLPVPFNQDYTVDYKGLEKYVDFLATSGIPNVMTTVGTSRFNLLSWDEIKKVNEAVVRGASKRCVTIVANPTTGGVASAIDFGKHAAEIGADFYLLYFPERHYGEENTFTFFKEVASAINIDILIHEMPMRNGLGPGSVQYSIDLLHRLLAIDNIVGFKEEALDKDYSSKILSEVADKSIIIGAGGGMSRYLTRDFDYGVRAFLGGIGNFQPELELEFYNSLTSGNRERAEQIVNTIELPYFESVVPMGWHPSLKGALALKGLLTKYERPPMKQMSEEEISALRIVMTQNKWL